MYGCGSFFRRHGRYFNINRLSTHIVTEGYYGGTNPVQQPKGSLARGSKNLLVLANDKVTAWKGVGAVGGFTGSRYMANTPNGSYAGLGDKTSVGIGSIIGLIANALGFIGTGPLYITGVSRAVSASTALQFLLWKSSSYSGAGTGPITAGLDPPSAPTIAEVAADASTINSGTTSARIHFVRSSTGGRSRASTPSATLVVSGHKVRLTVAGADLTYASTAGADRLGIDLTQWGFGFSGPHYEYSEIAISSLGTVDGVANSIELEWSSADVAFKPLAPIDDYPPPASVFAVAMEDTLAVIGCYGDASGISATNPGTAIAVSLPVFIESFPPDNLLFLPEAPVGVLSRAADGFSFIGCKNSMHALLYTGGSPALSLRSIWPTTGIDAPHNMCLGDGGRLYAITSKRGLVRIGEKGEPETKWAEPVADIISGWTLANAVLVWDNDHQCVVAGHGKTLLAFNVQTEKWSTELDGTGVINGNICAGVTQQGGAIFASNDGISNIALYYFNQGSGTTWEAYLPSVPSPAIQDEIMQILGMGRFDNTSTVTVKVFTNGNTSSAKSTKTFTPSTTGPQHLPPDKLRPNVRGAMSHQLYISQAGSGGDAGVDVLESLGVSSNII